MKKIMVAALVAIVGLAFTVPASALEHEFGGYWRTRMYTQDNFSGDKDKALDRSQIDTRTRLYYTALLNDNLKFVNKFEFNSIWGDDNGGKLSADGTGHIRVKNSYVDANLGMVNAKIGQQGLILARGFILDDDYSGINLTVAGNTSLVYMKLDEQGYRGAGTNMGDDAQAYVIAHAFKAGDFTITPLALYADFADSNYTYMIGTDVDANFGALSLWGSFYYQGGVYDDANDIDHKAYLLAAGGNFAISDMVGIHGQAFYMSGDDNPNDGDHEEWFNIGGPEGQSYYWSEIMGYGIFDNQASIGAPGDKPTNITAINLGSTVKLTDKLSVTGDVWYAMLNEDNAYNEDKLGTELDLKITYQLIEGLTLDVVGAYLFADDATSKTGSNDKDPYEFGTRLSLSF
ncbi:MAG: hypothetical protein RBQ72_10330 [Desulfobacterium sp.]|jgi:hypothetical protein|nr:hypothetical protein [Desulfobacterium sp.]